VELEAESVTLGRHRWTVLVTVNRCLAVCRPYDPPQRRSVEAARLHVLLVAVFSLVYSLPRYFEYDVVQRQVRALPLPIKNIIIIIVVVVFNPGDLYYRSFALPTDLRLRTPVSRLPKTTIADIRPRWIEL